MVSRDKSHTSKVKKELIMNTMKAFFKEGKAGTVSVSEIAARAGIAKGGIYYYFRTKEEIMDALVEQEYDDIISTCGTIIRNCNLPAIERFALLLKTYRSSYIDPTLDSYLHLPQNAALHQKSLARILNKLSPILKEIIELGVREGTFYCKYPEEYAQIVLSVFTFLLDPGIFTWTGKQYQQKVSAIALLLEQGLEAPKGSFHMIV